MTAWPGLSGRGSQAGRAAAAWALQQVGKPYLWGCGYWPARLRLLGTHLGLLCRSRGQSSLRHHRPGQDRHPGALDELQPSDLRDYLAPSKGWSGSVTGSAACPTPEPSLNQTGCRPGDLP